jgi:hypothetical protein
MNVEKQMIQAIKEDRERFFKKADVYVFTNNRGLTDKQIVELEELRNKFRDITTLPNYPDINWPPSLPDWFPNPFFASCWKSGYLQKMTEKIEQHKNERKEYELTRKKNTQNNI